MVGGCFHDGRGQWGQARKRSQSHIRTVRGGLGLRFGWCWVWWWGFHFFAALVLHGAEFADGAVPGAFDGGFVAAESVEVAGVGGHADGDALVVVDGGFGVDGELVLQGVEVVFKGCGFHAAGSEEAPVILRDLVGEAMFLGGGGLVFGDNAGAEFLVFGFVFVTENDLFGGEAVFGCVLRDGGGCGFAERAPGEACVAAVGFNLSVGCHGLVPLLWA